MEDLVRLNRFMQHYIDRLTADLPDGRMTEQPANGGNHAAWLLGHLAIAADYGLPLLGGAYLCSPDWHRTFAPGSKPQSDRSLYPGKEALVTAVAGGHAELARLAHAATAEQLDRPQPVEFLKPWVMTVRDLVGHLLTTHLATHIGQFSAWRRQIGLAPISL